MWTQTVWAQSPLSIKLYYLVLQFCSVLFFQKWPFRAPTTGTGQGGSGHSAAVGTWLYLLPFCWVSVFRSVTRSFIFQSDDFEPHLTHQTGHLNFLILLNLLFFLLIIFHNLHSLRLHKLIFLNVELLFCFPVYSASSLTLSIKVIMYLISFCMFASLTEQMLMSNQERKAATSGLLCFVVLYASMCKAHGNYNPTSYPHFINEEIEAPRNEKTSLLMQLEDGGPMLRI